MARKLATLFDRALRERMSVQALSTEHYDRQHPYRSRRALALRAKGLGLQLLDPAAGAPLGEAVYSENADQLEGSPSSAALHHMDTFLPPCCNSPYKVLLGVGDHQKEQKTGLSAATQLAL